MKMNKEQSLVFIGLVIGLTVGVFGHWYGCKMAARKKGLAYHFYKVSRFRLENNATFNLLFYLY